MANMVIPNEGKDLLLYWMLGTDGSDLEDFLVDLFINNYTPIDASTLADFTLATFTGYAQESVLRSAFAAPAIVADVSYITLAGTPTFICTGGSPQTAYGWVMQGATSGKVIAAQKFDVARVMSTGATETLDPFKFALKSFA